MNREAETGEGAVTLYEFTINGRKVWAPNYDAAWKIYLYNISNIDYESL